MSDEEDLCLSKSSPEPSSWDEFGADLMPSSLNEIVFEEAKVSELFLQQLENGGCLDSDDNESSDNLNQSEKINPSTQSVLDNVNNIADKHNNEKKLQSGKEIRAGNSNNVDNKITSSTGTEDMSRNLYSSSDIDKLSHDSSIPSKSVDSQSQRQQRRNRSHRQKKELLTNYHIRGIYL